MITIKHAYEPPDKHDGIRILVDRLWPRGLSKEKAKIDIWVKDIAPSTELRKWFNHLEERWPEFKKRYADELSDKFSILKPCIEFLEQQYGTVTLVYAARDPKFNNAIVLKSLF